MAPVEPNGVLTSHALDLSLSSTGDSVFNLTAGGEITSAQFNVSLAPNTQYSVTVTPSTTVFPASTGTTSDPVTSPEAGIVEY